MLALRGGADNDNSERLPQFVSSSGVGLVAQQHVPFLDRLDRQQTQHCPRVAGEAITHVFFAARPDDETRTVSDAIADRAAENDEPVVGECVHERRMPCPVFLFAHRLGIDPRRPLLTDDDVIGDRDDGKWVMRTQPVRRVSEDDVTTFVGPLPRGVPGLTTTNDSKTRQTPRYRSLRSISRGSPNASLLSFRPT